MDVIHYTNVLMQISTLPEISLFIFVCLCFDLEINRSSPCRVPLCAFVTANDGRTCYLAVLLVSARTRATSRGQVTTHHETVGSLLMEKIPGRRRAG